MLEKCWGGSSSKLPSIRRKHRFGQKTAQQWSYRHTFFFNYEAAGLRNLHLTHSNQFSFIKKNVIGSLYKTPWAMDGPSFGFLSTLNWTRNTCPCAMYGSSLILEHNPVGYGSSFYLFKKIDLGPMYNAMGYGSSIILFSNMNKLGQTPPRGLCIEFD